MVNNCILSRIERRKRDRLLKEDPCVLSIYTQDYRLLIRLKAEDKYAAQEWHQAFSEVMGTYDESHAALGEASKALEEEKGGIGGRGKSGDSYVLPEDLSKKLSLHSKLVWKTASLQDGVRVLKEVGMTKLFSCLLASCVIPGTPQEIMEAVVNRQLEWDEEMESMEVVEETGSNSRVEYIKLKPYRIGPFSFTPRDMVLKR